MDSKWGKYAGLWTYLVSVCGPYSSLQYELAGVMGKGPPQKIGIFVYSDNPWLFKKWEMNDISVWLKIVWFTGKEPHPFESHVYYVKRMNHKVLVYCFEKCQNRLNSCNIKWYWHEEILNFSTISKFYTLPVKHKEMHYFFFFFLLPKIFSALIPHFFYLKVTNANLTWWHHNMTI